MHVDRRRGCSAKREQSEKFVCMRAPKSWPGGSRVKFSVVSGLSNSLLVRKNGGLCVQWRQRQLLRRNRLFRDRSPPFEMVDDLE